MADTRQEEQVQSGYRQWLRSAFVRRNAGATAFALFNSAILVSWRRLGLRPTDRILDVGCGAGTLLCFLTRKVGFREPAQGVDITPEQVELARQVITANHLEGKVVVQAGSALALPFPDASFDVVVSSHVLHNLSDENLAVLFAEVRRVLKPGGRFIAWAFGSDRAWWSRLGKQLLHLIMRPPADVQQNTWFRDFATLARFARGAGFPRAKRLRLRPWFFTPTPRVTIEVRK